MKKKIISSLLAVCLFVGMAVPAFADSISGKIGGTNEVTKIVVAKDAYSIAKDANVEFAKEVTPLVSDKQLADGSTMTYSLTNNGELAFVVDTTGKVTAVEEKGTATLTIASEDGKVKAEVKLTATKKAATVKASGYVFEKPEYKLPVNVGAEEAVLKIVATPTGAKFSPEQAAAIMLVVNGDSAAVPAVAPFDFGKTGVTINGVATADGDSKIKVTFANTALAALADPTDIFTPATKELIVTLPYYDDASKASARKATTKIGTVKYAKKTLIASKGTLSVKVGQEIDLADNIKQGPSSATNDDTVAYSVEYANSTATEYDFVNLVGSKLKGIAVGQLKITAKLAGGAETSFLVNVVPYAPTAPAVKPTTATYAKMVVGGTYKIVVKDAGTAVAAFTSYNDKIVTVDKDGNVKAIAAGTGKIKVVVGETTLYVNVAVAAAPAPVAPDKKPTTPPQTGISLF